MPCCTPFSLPSISLHIRKEEMLLTLPSSSIIHLMEDWNCVSATAQILYQTRCATAALPPSCLLVVVAFLCARHLPRPLISSLSCIVTRWHLQARLRPTPSVSDQHYTMTTVTETAEPERSPLLLKESGADLLLISGHKTFIITHILQTCILCCGAQ